MCTSEEAVSAGTVLVLGMAYDIHIILIHLPFDNVHIIQRIIRSKKERIHTRVFHPFRRHVTLSLTKQKHRILSLLPISFDSRELPRFGPWVGLFIPTVTVVHFVAATALKRSRSDAKQ